MSYTNSALVAHKRISPNKTENRNHKIDTVTVHVIEGQITAERLGEIFASPTRRASSNYCVDKDGRIGLFVEEKDRAWTSGSSANDNRAVTIEIASDTTQPYAVRDNVIDSLVELLVDICKRNKIPALLWKNDKSLIGRTDQQNMTVHRWFQDTSCPGEYMMEKMGEIAERVNEKLGRKAEEKVSFKKGDLVSVRAGASYYGGGKIPSWVTGQNWYVHSANGARIVLNENEARDNAILSPVNKSDLTLVTSAQKESGVIRKGALVRIRAGASYYASSVRIPAWVTKQNWYVKEVRGERVVVDENEEKTNSILSAVMRSDCTLVR